MGRARARHAASRETQTLTTISDPNANRKDLEGRHSNSTAVTRLGFSRLSFHNRPVRVADTLVFFLDRSTGRLLQVALLQGSQCRLSCAYSVGVRWRNV